MVQPIVDSDYQLVGLIESAPRGYKKNLKSAGLAIVRFLLGLVDKKYETLKRYAARNDIPYFFMTSSENTGLVRWIEDKGPDIIVVFSMSQLLKEKIFSLPRFGTINLHTSFLPSYRGPNPDFWHYYNAELNPGVTVHYIDGGEDTGDIIMQTTIDIPLGIKSPDFLDRLINKVGVPILLESIWKIVQGESQRTKQARFSPTSRARNLDPSEHEKLIDWENWSTERIWHLLRGTETWFNALPQPRGIMHGQRWEIGRYQIVGRQLGAVGTIKKLNKSCVVITRNGFIELNVRFKIKNLVLKILGK